MRPTIQDVSFLLSVHRYGEYYEPEYTLEGITFKCPETESKRKKKHILAYKTFHGLFAKSRDEEVSDKEHAIFLIYSINKFIFYNSSVAITKERTLALALAEGRSNTLAF